MEGGLQLGLKCLAPLPDGRCLLVGWASASAKLGAELAVMDGEAACPIEHSIFLPMAECGEAGLAAFTFCLFAGQLPAIPRILLQAGDRAVEATVEDSEPGLDLVRLLAEQPPALGFTLLRDAAGQPALAGLLDFDNRPFGAFADWITRLHPVRGKQVEAVPGLEEVESLTSLAGDVLVVVRGSAPFPPEARLEVALIGLAPDGRGASQSLALPLLEAHVAALPQALVFHGRIDPAWIDRLSLLEVVLEVRIRAEEPLWLRCRPRSATAPDLLDAVCRMTPFADAGEAAAAAALNLLRLLTARREAAFGPMLASLAAQRPREAGGQLPRLGLILGADDPIAARLFQVTAPEFEGRCDQLLILGDAAEEVAQPFLRRGRLPVLVGPAALDALREAGGRAGVLAVEAPRFAAAVARGRPAEAFSRALGAADLARLLALHGVAGCEPSLADSLVRLLRLERVTPGEAAFQPVQRGWSSPHAAEVVNAHLARLWTQGPTEAARHV